MRPRVEEDAPMLVHIEDFKRQAVAIARPEVLLCQGPLHGTIDWHIERRRSGLIGSQHTDTRGVAQRQLREPGPLPSNIASKGLFNVHCATTTLPGFLGLADLVQMALLWF